MTAATIMGIEKRRRSVRGTPAPCGTSPSTVSSGMFHLPLRLRVSTLSKPLVYQPEFSGGEPQRA